MLDEPPKDPEIVRWFHAVGPPPTGQAPPHLRAAVRARIARHQAWPGPFAWLARVTHPAWVAALAMILALSVGLNVWWGVSGEGRHPSGARHAAETSVGDLSTAERLRTYRFQAAMQQVTALGPLVAAHAPGPAPAAVVGFTPQAARSAFFRIGTLYAEALAALQGGAGEAAGPRLDLLAQALTSVQAPRVLTQYLSEITHLRQSQREEDAVMARFLALFEPLYEDAYAQAASAEGVLLFRVGAWTENMALAAATSDAAALRRGGQAVEEVRTVLTRLHAPPEALAALARLRPLLTRRALTGHEMRAIGTLVQDIQERLST
jgi:hypothetical protein